MRPHATGLPEGVVVAERHHVVPEGGAAFEILPVGIRKRTEAEKEFVAVVRSEIESRGMLHRGLRPREPACREKLERTRQQKGTMVMYVVAEEPIGLRCLR